jgi:hypothetical protein
MTIASRKSSVISKRSTLGAVHKCLKPDEWDRFYTKAIEKLQPGITQFTVHLAYDDEEIRVVRIDHSDYDAAWRQRELDFFTSKRTKELLEKMTFTCLTGANLASSCGTNEAGRSVLAGEP